MSHPLSSPTGSDGAGGVEEMTVHVPSFQPATSGDANALDLEWHRAQLAQPARAQILQGEMCSLYVLLAPSLLQRHPWLQLPWGRKLVRAERQRRKQTREMRGQSSATEAAEAAADAAVLTRTHPCPLSLHIRMRGVSIDEAARHADAVSSRMATMEAAVTDEGQDDAGGDIVHDPAADGADDEAGEARNGESGDAVDEESSQRPRASTTSSGTDSTSGSRTTRSTSNSVRHPPAQRFAFRKSTLSVPGGTTPSASAFNSPNARPAPPSSTRRGHHPSRLAPGYSPYHPTTGGAASAVLNHMQADQHAAPGLDARATQPPQVRYFYFEPAAPTQQHAADDTDAAAGSSATGTTAGSSSTASPSASAYLVLHVSCVVSILPAFLTSPSAPASPSWHLGSSVVCDELRACNQHSASPMQLLALELSLVSPPAPHHHALAHATLQLPTTGHFTVDNPLPGGVSEAALQGSADATPSYGYANLRAFVAQNRALQVPHVVPPARAYVTVVEPLVLTSRCILVGSGGGCMGDAGGDEGCGISSAAGGGEVAASGGAADLCIEFTVRNASVRWSVEVQRLEFLLNRTRVFVRTPPSHTQGAALTRPPSLTSPSPSPSPAAFPQQRAEQRSVHYLPLSHFFSMTMCDGSTGPGSAGGLLPMRLAPHEQLNLLCFLAAPLGGERLAALESLVRGCLSPSGVSLVGSPPPYRTPYTVHYRVAGLGDQQAERAIVQQSRVIWRGAGVTGHASAGGGGSASVSPTLGSRGMGQQLASPPTSRLDRWPALSPPPSFISPSQQQLQQQLQQQPGTFNVSLSAPVKLSLRLKVASPVPLHRAFPLFLTLSNLADTPTPTLQLLLLPNSHPIVLQAMRLQKAEEAMQRRRSRASDGDMLLFPFTPAAVASGGASLASVHPFSPSSPPPPLLFSPHTPFTPSTPFIDSMHELEGSPSTRGGGGDEGQPRHSPKPQHFPFPPVEHAMMRRSSTNGGQHASREAARASQAALSSSNKRRGGGGGPISVQTGGAADLPDATPLQRRDSSGQEVVTTTLSHFLSSSPSDVTTRPGNFNGSVHEIAAAAAAAAAAPAATAVPVLCDDNSPVEHSDAAAAPLVCLDTALPLGSIPAQGERSLTLHFLALREGLLSLSTLFVFDPAAQTYYRLIQAPTVFACKQ